jgi:hypothetical protein
MAHALPDWFVSPPAAARGAPFWAWNDRLDRHRLLRQLAAWTDAYRLLPQGLLSAPDLLTLDP